MRTAWKVFGKGYSGRLLLSVVACGMALIRYERGVKNFAPRWLREKGYHPLVFKRKKDAVLFARYVRSRYGGKGIIIEKVEVGKKVPLPLICSYPDLVNGEIIPTHFDRWPEGTMMVEWVRPLKSEKRR